MTQQQQIAKRQAQLVIGENGQEISTRLGRYSNTVTAQLAKSRAGKIVTIGEITKVQYGQKAREGSYTEQYVRGKLTKAVNMLLHSGIPAIPIYESTGFHKKIGIKVISEYNDEDYRLLTEYQEAAVTRGDLSRDKADLINTVMKSLRKEESSMPETATDAPDPAPQPEPEPPPPPNGNGD